MWVPQIKCDLYNALLLDFRKLILRVIRDYWPIKLLIPFCILILRMILCTVTLHPVLYVSRPCSFKELCYHFFCWPWSHKIVWFLIRSKSNMENFRMWENRAMVLGYIHVHVSLGTRKHWRGVVFIWVGTLCWRDTTIIRLRYGGNSSSPFRTYMKSALMTYSNMHARKYYTSVKCLEINHANAHFWKFTNHDFYDN